MIPFLDLSDAINEVKKQATSLRRDLGLGSDAAVNLFELLGHLDLQALRWPMGTDGPDGCYLPEGKLAVIAVNSSREFGHQRFTACHELAHHLFDTGIFVDRDIFTGESFSELRANTLAAHFLMPAEGVRRWLRRDGWKEEGPLPLNPTTVVHLAHHFGVSYVATLYHLETLGWLASGSFQELETAQPEQVALSLGYDLEIEKFERGRQQLPADFVRRVLQAYSAGDISPLRLPELLRTDEPTAIRHAVEAGAESPKPSLDELIEEARRA